jgi:hypothetical protein
MNFDKEIEELSSKVFVSSTYNMSDVSISNHSRNIDQSRAPPPINYSHRQQYHNYLSTDGSSSRKTGRIVKFDLSHH